VYCHNDPANCSDPTGLAGSLDEGGDRIDGPVGGLGGQTAGQMRFDEQGQVFMPDGTLMGMSGATDSAGVGSSATIASEDAANSADAFDLNGAIASAKAARRAIGDVPQGKTVATTQYGQRTLSGWEHSGWEHGAGDESGYASPADETVMAQAGRMGFDFRDAGAFDRGISGRYYASHAEPQMSEIAPDEPMAVSRVMCSECQRYFKVLARYAGIPQVVADPYDVRVFYPDGRVLVQNVRGTTLLYPDGRTERL